MNAEQCLEHVWLKQQSPEIPSAKPVAPVETSTVPTICKSDHSIPVVASRATTIEVRRKTLNKRVLISISQLQFLSSFVNS